MRAYTHKGEIIRVMTHEGKIYREAPMYDTCNGCAFHEPSLHNLCLRFSCANKQRIAVDIDKYDEYIAERVVRRMEKTNGL